jgi:hypothetical protein
VRREPAQPLGEGARLFGAPCEGVEGAHRRDGHRGVAEQLEGATGPRPDGPDQTDRAAKPVGDGLIRVQPVGRVDRRLGLVEPALEERDARDEAGVFTFSRSGGNLAAALVTVSSQVDFPASQTSASLTITPVDDAQVEGAETVTLTLAPRPTYPVGSPTSASVTIADND